MYVTQLGPQMITPGSHHKGTCQIQTPYSTDMVTIQVETAICLNKPSR